MNLFQFLRRTKLEGSPFSHHYNLIRTFEGGQPMGDGQHCAAFELLSDNFLNDLIVLLVDVGRGFVDDDNLAFLEEGPADAEELFFSC